MSKQKLHSDPAVSIELFDTLKTILKSIKDEETKNLFKEEYKSSLKALNDSNKESHAELGVKNLEVIESLKAKYYNQLKDDPMVDIIRGKSTESYKDVLESVTEIFRSSEDPVRKVEDFLKQNPYFSLLFYIYVPNDYRNSGSSNRLIDERAALGESLRSDSIKKSLIYPYMLHKRNLPYPDSKEYSGVYKLPKSDALALSGIFYELMEGELDGLITPSDIESASKRVSDVLDSAEISLLLEDLTDCLNTVSLDEKLRRKYAMKSKSDFKEDITSLIKALNTDITSALSYKGKELFHSELIRSAIMEVNDSATSRKSVLDKALEVAYQHKNGNYGNAESMVNGFFSRQKVNFLISSTGTGKSVLTCAMAHDLIESGTMLGGRFVVDEELDGKIKVMIIHTEKGAGTSWERYIKRSGLDGLDRFSFYHADVFKQTFEEPMDITKKSHMNLLNDIISIDKPDILILDTIGMAVAEENCNKEAKVIMNSLQTIAATHNLNILAVHHTRKGDSKKNIFAPFSIDEAAGASTFLKQADSAWGIVQVRDENTGLAAKKTGRLFMLKQGSLDGLDDWRDIRYNIKEVSRPVGDETDLRLEYCDYFEPHEEQSDIKELIQDIAEVYESNKGKPQRLKCMNAIINLLSNGPVRARDLNKKLRNRKDLRFSNRVITESIRELISKGKVEKTGANVKTTYSLKEAFDEN